MTKQHCLTLSTNGRSFIDITNQINNIISENNFSAGICHLFLQHTSASIILCENADPSVRTDLENFMQRLVRDGDPNFTHTFEGDDDMSAHIRSVLTKCDLTIPVSEQRLNLGTWQGVFLWEHRYHSHNRKILITLIGN